MCENVLHYNTPIEYSSFQIKGHGLGSSWDTSSVWWLIEMRWRVMWEPGNCTFLLGRNNCLILSAGPFRINSSNIYLQRQTRILEGKGF